MKLRLLLVAVPLCWLLSAPAAWAFSDVSTHHRYYAAIQAMADQGVIQGYTDGTYGPAKEIRRAQFAKMIVRYLGLPTTEADVCPFTDVERPADSLYPDNFVAVAARYEITKGTTPTTFAPYDDITVAQVLTMVVRAADRFYPGVVAQVPDENWWPALPSATPEHDRHSRRAEYADLISRIPFESWDPWRPATRGEVVQILWNLKQKLDGAWNKSALTPPELRSLVQSGRGAEKVFLPASFPAGWAVAAPFQVGPVRGYIEENPALFPAGGDNRFRTGYTVYFTNGERYFWLSVDPHEGDLAALGDFFYYGQPVITDAGFSLGDAPWQVAVTADHVVIYADVDRATLADAYYIVNVECRPEDREAALSLAQQMTE